MKGFQDSPGTGKFLRYGSHFPGGAGAAVNEDDLDGRFSVDARISHSSDDTTYEGYVSRTFPIW